MMNLKQAEPGIEYKISKIEINDKELSSFLFSLGCYEGESIAVVRHLRGSSIIAIKNGRYNIDGRLAEAIKVHP